MAELTEKEINEINEFADNLACDFISAIEDNTGDKPELTPMHILSMFEAAGQALAEAYDLMPPEIQQIAIKLFTDNLSTTSEEPN